MLSSTMHSTYVLPKCYLIDLVEMQLNRNALRARHDYYNKVEDQG